MFGFFAIFTEERKREKCVNGKEKGLAAARGEQ